MGQMTQPTVKALKEVVVLRIGFNPTSSTTPCYNTTQYTCMQCTQSTTHTKINLSNEAEILIQMYTWLI